MMRCDLHVHSLHSGPPDLPVLSHMGRECYSEPRAVYGMARRRGMDLVTLTDHDSIAGALDIRGLPGTFVSEEVTCVLPGDRELHLGVFDITEAQHKRITHLRYDAEALFAYLAEERVPACVNHLFSALTGRRALPDFDLALSGVPLIEARNGMMPATTNAYAAAVGRRAGLGPVGGSDAHTLASVAGAWTEVPGATSREEFLAGLRRGLTVPAGGSGSYARLTRDVALVFAGGYRENARCALDSVARLALFGIMVAAAPVLALVPVFTAAIYVQERLFAARYHRLFQDATALRLQRSAPSGPWTPGAAPSPVQG